MQAVRRASAVDRQETTSFTTAAAATPEPHFDSCSGSLPGARGESEPEHIDRLIFSFLVSCMDPSSTGAHYNHELGRLTQHHRSGRFAINC